MGSVNTQSVREEAERIKAEFQRIAENKKIDTEINGTTLRSSMQRNYMI